ncbi:SusC/RagA family TonB-linked outer membrane protein [Mangrovibacterium lignilyticum]|uniref:SusC/RagA family TonB-linked outer membrane protein n=1 Tax=Mangrovibacterium lignilyticum TaxID=2668052 RepID=UPI0013D51B86|nr:SusC/RagA family TonB-linked outer membrane protein [Mangrovibacterium lignilyticum]
MKKSKKIRDWYALKKTLLIMRLTALFLLIGFFQVSALSGYSQQSRMTISLTNTRLADVLNEIENLSEYYFLYNQDLIDVNRRVSIVADNQEINNILDDLFENTTVKYVIKDRQIILTNLGEDFRNVQQKGDVKGKVTAPDGEPIPGATVVVKGTSNGTITDFDGFYQLSNVPADAVLQVSFVGMRLQEIDVNGLTAIDVVLQEETIGLEEVVAVGYGVQKKSLVTGAISSVKAEDLQSVPVARADQAIQGRTAGVSVLSTSGSPGASTKIRIRGVNSNGNSNPLFIVDGMKTGDINNIDPADIESMEVLKDAASAAIYGTEGANGVIIITTKSGTKGNRAKITYDFQYGVQSARSDMELMNAAQYKQWMAESGAGEVTLDGTDTDWMDEVFGDAPMQKHHVSYSSGTEKSSYMLSGSYFSQDGIVGGDKARYQRYTARVNSKSNMNKWLEVGNNMSFSHSKQRYIGEDDEYRSVVNNSLLIDPLTPVTYDGTPDNVQSLLDQGYSVLQNEEGQYYGLAKYVTGETTNPLALLQTYHNTIEQDKILGSAYATIKPLKGLSITSRIGLDLTYQVQHSWTPEYYFSSENQNTMTTIDDTINKWYTWLWENFASYNVSVADHDITLLAGYSAQEYQAPDWTMHSGPMIAPGDQYAYQGYRTSTEFDQVGGLYVNQTMNSYFGRLSYSYLSKYLLEGSIRRDAASVFPSNNRAAYFPAVSAGWVISQEDFFASETIDYLKLRGSWGENGSKSNLPGNEDQEFWVFSGIKYPGADDVYQSGAEIEKLINTDLRWERTKQVDIGVDLRAFGSKLNFAVDYYNKKTTDLIVTGTGPLSVGKPYPFVNGGDVVNKGFDFELGYRGDIGDFKYSVNFNLSTLDNEVSSLNVDSPVAGDNLRGYNLTWFEEGYPIWYFKGYKTAGIDAATGDPIVVDTDEDGEITAADQTYIGDPHPDLLYGATLNCAYKGIDLNVFIQGTQGNDVFMGWFRSDRPFSNKPAFMFEDRWTANHTNASRPAANNTSDYVYRSDLMISDGSYLRIKQIQVGYTLPASLTESMKIDKARLFVSLDDYFTFTDYQGLDPEAGSSTDNRQGVDRGIYPIAGKILFGFSLNF